MDPHQTLLDATDAADAGDYLTALELLEAYAMWRARGGFEPTSRNGRFLPMPGDRLALTLSLDLRGRLRAPNAAAAYMRDNPPPPPPPES